MADSPRIEELKRRVQSDPASIAFAALAEEYRRAGRFDEAIDTCKTGLTRHPSYLSAHVTLGRAFIEVGRLHEAREELEYVLKLAPENLAAIRGLAEIHHRIGEESPDPVDETGTVAAPVDVAAPAPPPIQLAVAVPEPTAEIPATDPIARRADESPATPAAPPLIQSATPVAVLSQALAPASAPIEYRAPADPALAGLEDFLNAIIRARGQRAAAR